MRSFRFRLRFIYESVTDCYSDVSTAKHMPFTSSQSLFAYGTLRSPHPEHKQCFANVGSIRTARIPGELWILAEGYPLLVVQPEQCLLRASVDSRSDWANALESPDPKNTPLQHADSLVEGERLELPLGNAALIQADRWEGFEPGRQSVYQRFVARLWLADGSSALSWIYGAFAPPPNATRFEGSRWPTPPG